METNNKNRIVLWSQQAFVAHGLASVLKTRLEFELAACDTLPATVECVKSAEPAVVLVYLSSGISLSELRELAAATRAPIALWGRELGSDLAFQVIQLGVRGILSNDISVDGLLTALQTMRGGGLCFEKELTNNLLCQTRVTLTRRERQLVSLVAQGLKNKEIAHSLGIAEGTVKVYLSRLFEKLGLKDRLDLALYGLRNLFSGYVGMDKRLETGKPALRELDPFGPHACLLPHGDRPRPGAPAVAVDGRNPRRMLV